MIAPAASASEVPSADETGNVRLVEVLRHLTSPPETFAGLAPHPLQALQGQASGLVESAHSGSLAVVDSEGRLLAAAGNPHLVAFLRSAAKPVQALPVIGAGAVDHYGLSQAELAVICASHHGTEEHVGVVQSILDKIGLDRDALRCGVHWPADEEAAHRLAARGQEPDARHNNCSGKHAGMMALARFWGQTPPASRTQLALDGNLDPWPSDYTLPEHPVQRAMLQRLANLAGLPASAIPYARDGCTVPTFALPLARGALVFARLIDAVGDEEPDCQSAARVVAAMQAYPHLVSGHGALDDELMRAGRGALVSKGGAEGYQAVGVRTPDGRAVGITLKMADGNPRGKGPVIFAVLKMLRLVDGAILERLESLRQPQLRNRGDQVVGEIRTVLKTDDLVHLDGRQGGGHPLMRFDPPLPLL